MIDLHCHILPGLDDGSPDMETSVAMARMAAADGVTRIVCTPHMMPGVYDNTVGQIRVAVEALRQALAASNIPLRIDLGADVHIVPDLEDRLADGRVPRIGDSQSFLFEPPHDIMPPTLVPFGERLLSAGYLPILTHPERLRWIEGHFDAVKILEKQGMLIQVTAGAITGRFGSRARYWAERMLDEGMVDFVASDAHNLTSRPPVLSDARDAAAQRVGEAEALALVLHRPAALLAGESLPPSRSTAPAGRPETSGSGAPAGFWGKLASRFGGKD